jgi:hypothetical protein
MEAKLLSKLNFKTKDNPLLGNLGILLPESSDYQQVKSRLFFC